MALEIEESIRTQLLTKSAVTALVGTGTSARIWPDKIPQKVKLSDGPGIVVSVNRETHANDLSHRGGQRTADCSIVACAETKADARELAEAIRFNTADPDSGLGTGLAGDEWTNAAATVGSCCLDYSEPSFVPYSDDSDEGIYLVDSHYIVIHEESP